MKAEPKPNRYSSPQNYIDALSEYWTTYGGPSNRNRAIATRLQIWFDREHIMKKLHASNARNLRREFKEAAGAVANFNRGNSNNNNNSNSNMSRNAPSKGNTSAIQKIMKQLQKTNKRHSNASNKLLNISNTLVRSKKKLSHQKYNYVRNVMIPRTKARIRAQNSTRMFEQLRNKLGTKLPSNIVSRILSNNVVPSGLMRIGKKVRTYWGKKTNLEIYTNKNGRFWFQDKHGRWYTMTSPSQRWYYHNVHRKWIPHNL